MEDVKKSGGSMKALVAVIIVLVALLIGIVAPFAFFHIRNLLNMSVRGRKDIEDYTTIPVLGEIPHRKEGISDSEILVGDQKSDSINEAEKKADGKAIFVPYAALQPEFHPKGCACHHVHIHHAWRGKDVHIA